MTMVLLNPSSLLARKKAPPITTTAFFRLPTTFRQQNVRSSTQQGQQVQRQQGQQVQLLSRNTTLFPGARSNTTMMMRRVALTLNDVPQRIKDCQYAVRGEIVQCAENIDRAIAQGQTHFPFRATLPANIGNPQAVGQKPITFHRQVLSCLLNPELIVLSTSTTTTHGIPSDVSTRAGHYLQDVASMGAYSHSKGVPAFRNQIAKWFGTRDGLDANPETIFITDGASPGVRLCLEMMLNDARDGVLIPTPQYPLYSASITRLGGTAIPYYLKENQGWSLDVAELNRALAKAKADGVRPRAFVLINPGNPTGAILDRTTLEEVCKFCAEHGLLLFADEVYQENVYGQTPFISCRKVCLELQLSDLQVVSFHSCSKGIMGECGLRGGLFQAHNFDDEVLAQMYKLSSVSLCSNTVGQALMTSILHPPQPGEPSYERYHHETQSIYTSLKRKAKLVCDVLNTLEGVSCQKVEGAMYAFPTITLRPGAIEAAKKEGVQPDLFYCIQMLNQTGVVVVPGSGFGQEPGTWHFRMTILPEETTLTKTMGEIEAFHRRFMQTYG